MKPSSTKFLLFLFLFIFFIALLVCVITMSQGVTTVYGAEPSPTMDLGYVTPTVSGYPAPVPTSDHGYPAPVPTEPYSRPPSPMTMYLLYKSQLDQLNSVESENESEIEATNTIIVYPITHRIIVSYGQPILKMR